ncbi:hypothetical protein HDU84_003517 [Entophlyctis sp. JEL0112]|nr:hypothetical protein HDU84_003517 [Entophlyctis sp. JEL0112]
MMAEALAAAGIGLRVVLMQQSAIADAVAARVEVSTPVTAFKRMQEGVFLFRNNVDPYDGGLFHQAPFLLALFHAVDERAMKIIFILVDVLISVLLLGIARTRAAQFEKQTWVESSKTSGGKSNDPTIPSDAPLDPKFVAAAYLVNPLSILTCLARSTLVFNSLAVVAAVFAATRGSRVASMFFLSFAAYLSVYPVMLILPFGLLIAQAKKLDPLQSIFSCSVFFAACLMAWLGLSNLLMGSWNFVANTYGVILLVPDLTPNIGLWWYIFIEMFDQFRLFFLIVFQVFVFAFSVPLTLKFNEHPMFLVGLFLIIIAAFKSYPSVGDVALYIPFVLMYQELFKYMKRLYVIVNLGAYSLVLLPLFYNLWIYAGSGNANFFYAITLVVGMGQVLLISDYVGGMVRREWERVGGGSGANGLRARRVEVVLK